MRKRLRLPSLKAPGPLLVVAAILMGSTFVVDLLLPLGVVDAIPYVLVVLLGLWAPWRGFALAAASAATVLAGLGALLSPPGGILWMDVLNRLLSLASVWLATALVVRHRKTQDVLRTQEAFARLGEMAAVVAHEVRNPLAGIASAEQVIGQRLPAGAPEREVVGSVLGRIAALNQLTEELLVFARPRPPQLLPLRLRLAIQEAALLLASDPNGRGVPVEVEGSDPELPGDARLLKEAFFNLFLNAAQAMGKGRPIRVSVQERGGACLVQIRDTGKGIPPEARQRVFEPFFTTKHRGTGLGLPVVKRSVEAHGGRVTGRLSGRRRHPGDRRPPARMRLVAALMASPMALAVPAAAPAWPRSAGAAGRPRRKAARPRGRWPCTVPRP